MKFLTKTSVPGFEIHAAEAGDESIILEFIRALAEYEKLADEVVANSKDLHKYLFSENKVAEVLIGVYKKEAVGFAIFFQNFSTFLAKPGIYLEDLFILEEFRGKGLGKSLLTYLAKLTVERGCGRLEWAVLDWNEPSIKFYESLGAQTLKEWMINRVSGEGLIKMAGEFEGKE